MIAVFGNCYFEFFAHPSSNFYPFVLRSYCYLDDDDDETDGGSLPVSVMLVGWYVELNALML